MRQIREDSYDYESGVWDDQNTVTNNAKDGMSRKGSTTKKTIYG